MKRISFAVWCEILAAFFATGALVVALIEHHWVLATWTFIALSWIGNTEIQRRDAEMWKTIARKRR